MQPVLLIQSRAPRSEWPVGPGAQGVYRISHYPAQTVMYAHLSDIG